MKLRAANTLPRTALRCRARSKHAAKVFSCRASSAACCWLQRLSTTILSTEENHAACSNHMGDDHTQKMPNQALDFQMPARKLLRKLELVRIWLVLSRVLHAISRVIVRSIMASCAAQADAALLLRALSEALLNSILPKAAFPACLYRPPSAARLPTSTRLQRVRRSLACLRPKQAASFTAVTLCLPDACA